MARLTDEEIMRIYRDTPIVNGSVDVGRALVRAGVEQAAEELESIGATWATSSAQVLRDRLKAGRLV